MHRLVETDPVLVALKATGTVSMADLQFLAEEGQAYKGIKLPWFIEQRKPGKCFEVAAELERDLEYDYVRGFALIPDGDKPLPHAWAGEGRYAIDPSWSRQTECKYFGIKGQLFENRLDKISHTLHDAYGIGPPKWLCRWC